ncbi:MAG: hypothetical protein FWH26_02855, partial [Oscillospiraceae bacterium]|nr:hypothetical protein [Oscillospiraceae bacterium]
HSLQNIRNVCYHHKGTISFPPECAKAFAVRNRDMRNRRPAAPMTFYTCFHEMSIEFRKYVRTQKRSLDFVIIPKKQEKNRDKNYLHFMERHGIIFQRVFQRRAGCVDAGGSRRAGGKFLRSMSDYQIGRNHFRKGCFSDEVSLLGQPCSRLFVMGGLERPAPWREIISNFYLNENFQKKIFPS